MNHDTKRLRLSPVLLVLAALALAPMAEANHHHKQHARCDVDGNGKVDYRDIDAIQRAIDNKKTDKADGPHDPRDGNGDRVVDEHDLKVCRAKCSYKACAGGGGAP